MRANSRLLGLRTVWLTLLILFGAAVWGRAVAVPQLFLDCDGGEVCQN